MARTAAKTEARRRARARLAEKAEERRQREQAELEYVTDFEAALVRRDRAETEMSAAVAGLLELGNSITDIAALTEQPEAEIRRLRKLTAEPASAATESAADGDQAPPPGSSARTRQAGNGPSAPTFDTDAAGAASTGADWASSEAPATPDPVVALTSHR